MARTQAQELCDLHHHDHPLTSVKWRRCREAPLGMSDAQAVYLNGRIYIGGGETTSFHTDFTVLCYDSETDSWKTIQTPTRRSALTTYRSKLVLAGGEYAGLETRKLWSLQYHGRWTTELPPMSNSRRGASAVDAGDHLVVAGGNSDSKLLALDIVEVFDGRCWNSVEFLPKSCYDMKSALHNREWYLMGGSLQGKSVFCTSVDSLITTAGSSEGEGGSVWKTLPEAPLMTSSISMYGNEPLAIGGYGGSSQSAIHAYIADIQLWVHVGYLPVPMHSTCSIILPSEELLVVGGMSDKGTQFSSVLKAKLGVPNLEYFCAMAIVRNNIDYSILPLHLQKMVESHSWRR